MYVNFENVINDVKKQSPISIGIANAHDENLMNTIKKAVELNLIIPFFVGDKEKILSISHDLDFDLKKYEIFNADDEEKAAEITANLAYIGKTNAIMKGMINSTPFLRGLLKKEFKLVENRLLSHIAAFEVPGFNRLIYMTDGGLNISPNFDQKKQIINNSIRMLHSFGVEMPKVALLSANERVDSKMPITVEYKKISDLAANGVFGNAVVEGPLPLDLAISKMANASKGFLSQIDGEADLLVVPNIESGNILGKAIVHFGKGEMAGIVLGAKVPIILNSRSDSLYSKISSIALAKLMYSSDSIKR